MLIAHSLFVDKVVNTTGPEKESVAVSIPVLEKILEPIAPRDAATVKKTNRRAGPRPETPSFVSLFRYSMYSM